MQAHRHAGALAAIAATAVLCAAAGGAPPASVAYVDVSVATVWTAPTAPRAVDAPALRNPVDMRAWSGALTTALRVGLVGRVQTQALLGEPVIVLARHGSWARVVVADQPTPLDRRGYPGWIPVAQLADAKRFGRELAGPIVVVTSPTAWLTSGSRRMELSYGTRLPLLSSSRGSVRVEAPSGASGRIPAAAVTRYRSAAAIPRPTAAAVVAAARAFLGVRYLWGGTSAFGLDCSGLTELVFRAHGMVIPRDADPQARSGRAVSWSRLRPGDLIFYGHPTVHHVAMYAGGGLMLEAPDSSGSVRLTPVRTAELFGARRYAR